MPDNSTWDLFLGPAPLVAYHPVYHPFNWRGWVDWGVGAIGDMGAHLIDHAVLGARPRLSDDDRDRVDAVQQGELPDGHDDLLRVPRARRQAGREDDVVRRRPAPAEAARRSARRRSMPKAARSSIGSKGKLMYDTYG